jgi:signal transduction histidine kinase
MQTNLSPRHAVSPPADMTAQSLGASQDIDDFIYLISHDVRASVRALLELPQWLTEDLQESGIKVDGSLAATIELMNRHTGRLDRMLVDLLTFSRVGRMQVSRQINIATVLEEVLEQIRVPSGFEISTQLECSDVWMGERDLPTLLGALISNAIKHHDKDTGRILITSSRENGKVLIAVSDDGPGVEVKHRERVLAPMTTLQPRDKVEGSGMGLANANKIALNYGGSVTFGLPHFGRGTTIEVRVAAAHDS